MDNKLIFALLGVFFIFLLFRPDKTYMPSQEEIQNDYVDITKNINDYPYPQISRTFKRLSHGKPVIPLNNEDKILPKGEDNLVLIRNDDNVKTRMYLPDYYRKDRLSGNTITKDEYRPFVVNEVKSENSWTDETFPEHPKYYNSMVKDELTNIGSFFDSNNQYFDKSTPDSESLTSDRCYKDKNDNEFCEDNTRLQLIPPKLITDPNNKALLMI
jgi:hypothetical protein